MIITWKKGVKKMGKKLKHCLILFGPYLYLVGLFIMIFSKKTNLLVLTILALGIICYFYSRIYCIYLIIKTREKTHDKWVLHLILILGMGAFYVPIYYVQCVLKKKIVWGILLALVYPITVIVFLIAIIASGVASLNEYSDYVTNDGKVSVSLPNRFKCETKYIGEASIRCESADKIELFKIYNYGSDMDKDSLFDSYYNELYESYADNNRITIENIIRKDHYILFDVDEAGNKLQAIFDLKEHDDDNYSVIIYVATKNHSTEYSKIYSSIKARFLEDFA